MIAEQQKKTLHLVTEDMIKKISLELKSLTDDSKDIWSDIKQLKGNMSELNEIKRKLAQLARLPTEADFNQLKNRVDLIENINTNFKRRMDDFDKRLKKIESSRGGIGNQPDRVQTEEELSSDESLRSIVEKLQQDLKSYKEQNNKDIYKINQELINRVTFDDLQDAEARIISQITEMFQLWTGKFMTREELNRRFNTISRKMKEEGR